MQEGGEEVDRRLLQRWIPKLRLEIMDNSAKYKDISIAEVQKYFREWAIQDFDAIIQRPNTDLAVHDPYDSVWGPYDRDGRFNKAQFPGQTDEDREQNRKFSLSNKGALHHACLVIDSESIESIFGAEESGRNGSMKIVDVYALGRDQ
jgi:hypothetical protein